MMKIAVFALQGAFEEHEKMLAQLGAECVEIRRRAHFTGSFDGVILPGGESTVQGRLLREGGMLEPLREGILAGLPVFGTCAGMILLAKKISNDEAVYLGTMSAIVRRNAYGRQLGSFFTKETFGPYDDVPMTFIRGPIFEWVGENTEVLSRVDGKIVAAREGNMLATAFHPELTADTRVHEYFLDMAKKR